MNLQFELEEAERLISSLRLELAGLEQMRLRDNAELIRRCDAMEAEKNTAEAFHNLAVAQRNASWYECDKLREELNSLKNKSPV